MIRKDLYQNTVIRSTIFFEYAIGILGNAILLLFHILIFLLEHNPKPTDLPIGLLALTHLAMLITAAIIATDILMFWEGFWGDITCKSLVYLHRFIRALSVCITCLLSVLQAITLSPRNSWLAKFKSKSPHHYLCSVLVLWVFYMLANSHIFLSVIGTPNFTSSNLVYVSKSCSVCPISHTLRQVFSTLLTLREVFLMGLMFLSSGHMALLLCRHKRRSRHLHRTSLSPNASPEQRATRTILLLMSFFLVMSILFYSIHVSRIMWNDDPILFYILILVGHIYATVSPLVLISADKRVIIFVRTMCGRE
ncbi:PREDICTED: vomeronasal type-1 receptor 94-like [Dipodomys ordii]|uniref:Vomeronasal type-1 receptor n=1 Tax=Dipodomys ordii TaxID=10020 RepID=A0A1S3GG17_DIPOR|nr:PREDICTED: vomeronasal type-1 receptor 94-like [Dipodomys ordii]